MLSGLSGGERSGEEVKLESDLGSASAGLWAANGVRTSCVRLGGLKGPTSCRNSRGACVGVEVMGGGEAACSQLCGTL